MVDLERKITVDELLRMTSGTLLGGDWHKTIQGVSTDTRSLRAEDLFIPLMGERFDGHDFIPEAIRKGASAILIQKGRGRKEERTLDRTVWIEVDDTLEALGRMAHSWRMRHFIPVVGITGSNGKTSTKEMAAAVLGTTFRVLKTEGNLNNRIGLPLCLLRLTSLDQAAVLEMGMNLEGEIRTLCEIAKPTAGLITNIAPAHLEQLRDVNGVARAKGELFESLRREDTAIVNRDDPRCRALGERCVARRISFGLDEGADVRGDRIEPFRSDGAGFRLHIGTEWTPVRLQWIGIPAVYNALAAAAVGTALGVSLEAIQRGLESFRPVPMRMNRIELEGGIRILDDTYNANPRSMEMALEGLSALKGEGLSIAILGDMKELGDWSPEAHRSIGRKAASLRTDRLILMGDFAEEVAKGALQAGMAGESIALVESHEEAVTRCIGEAQEGTWILVKGSRAMSMERIVQGLLREKGRKTRGNPSGE